MPSRKATISEVAAQAGVAIKTVSRVLNKEKYVSAATRERVEAAMALLSFNPSAAARTLAGGRSFQIALICDNPSPYYVYEVQAGVRARCAEEGVRMLAQPYDRGAPNLLADIISLIDQVRPDGIILTPPVTDRADVIAALDARGIDYVCISPAQKVKGRAACYIDNQAAAADMVQYLIDLGHKRIGFISGDTGYAVSAQRLAGYRQALSEAQIKVDPALIIAGGYDFTSGTSGCAALMALAAPPTAIFASSDDIAAGVLAAAHHKGIAVPGALSIVGFDDSALAAVVWPPLTTIRQPVRDLGYTAADMLFSGPDAPQHRELAYSLIERASAAKIN
jgi:LacI family transcriptional regulator